MKLIDLLVKELPKRGGWPQWAARTAVYPLVPRFIFFDDKGNSRDGGEHPSIDIPNPFFYLEGKHVITRSQYEAAIAKNDGWIEWSGGECPVKPDSIVDVRFRAGGEEKAVPAVVWYWGRGDCHSDIIAYRLHRDINSRANDDRLERDLKEIEVSGKYLDDIMNIPVRIDRLERDLNECIGQEVDVINHPSHYTRGSVECIDAIASATVGKSGIEAVCVANAIKYLWRYEEKNGIEDVKKAAWYLNKLISELESK